ncbi:AraC family transcriptional regulator [Lacticaseibacillus parakribbianus]|uniref:AraC family transcriptional regulator n=1 Tax=Lacticaseibacillus parakribbianus TaxID=2970927 RepID=UPI0021CAFAC0|nr:AraC family transcriptional regulator [Lacticaseibacillus parakribbianus]
MSSYVEIPGLDPSFPVKVFDGTGDSAIAPHWHIEIEIIYALSGVVPLGLESGVVEIANGEFYIISSAVSHYFLPAKKSKRLVFWIHPSLFASPQTGYSFAAVTDVFATRNSYSVNWSAVEAQKFRLILDRLRDAQTQSADRLILFSNYIQLFECLVVGAPTDYSVSNAAKVRDATESLALVQEAMQYIQAHYAENVTLRQVSNAAGYSAEYFSRRFKQTTGLTFTRYLTMYRVNMAKYLLSCSSQAIDVVAMRAGFSSLQTFYRVFRQETGYPPLKFRRLKIENK